VGARIVQENSAHVYNVKRRCLTSSILCMAVKKL